MIKLRALLRYINERLILKEFFRKVRRKRAELNYFDPLFLSGQITSLETDEAVALFI